MHAIAVEADVGAGCEDGCIAGESVDFLDLREAWSADALSLVLGTLGAAHAARNGVVGDALEGVGVGCGFGVVGHVYEFNKNPRYMCGD